MWKYKAFKNRNQITAHNLFEHSKSEKLLLCQLLHCYLLVWGYPEIMALKVTVHGPEKNERVHLGSDCWLRGEQRPYFSA